MKFAKKAAALAVAGFLGLGGALFVGAAANAAAPTSVALTQTPCEFPDDEVESLSTLSKSVAEDKLDEGLRSDLLKCLDYKVVDKCDGRTVVTAVNWAVSDNKWTRLKFMILGHDYTVIGGPDHTPVVVTLGPPGVKDVQVYLVLEGTKDGTHWRIEIPLLKDLYNWKLPESCPTASPSPSVTASASPSPAQQTASPTTAAPSTSAPVVVPNDGGDLPTTSGVDNTTPIAIGGGAMALAVVLGGVLWYVRNRRRDEEVSAAE